MTYTKENAYMSLDEMQISDNSNQVDDTMTSTKENGEFKN
jgi:hypothetical protein